MDRRATFFLDTASTRSYNNAGSRKAAALAIGFVFTKLTVEGGERGPSEPPVNGPETPESAGLPTIGPTSGEVAEWLKALAC